MNAASPERYFPWDVLELDPTADQRAIKRAYARLLRRNNPEDDAQGFQRLREAYERAQQDARWIDHDAWDEDADSPAAPPDDAAEDLAASSGPEIAVVAGAEEEEKERGTQVRPALRIEPAAEPESPVEDSAPAEPALRVEAALEPEAAAPELWQGPERPALIVEPASDLVEAVAEADTFDELCQEAERVLVHPDAAAIETLWRDLLHAIDRAGIDARRRFGDWLFQRLHEFETRRAWGNPAVDVIPRSVWLTLDRQFGWAADEIKLGARHGEAAIISVMGAVRRARGEKAETARVAGGPDASGPPPDPNKTPWWVWWLVIWIFIGVIRLIAK